MITKSVIGLGKTGTASSAISAIDSSSGANEVLDGNIKGRNALEGGANMKVISYLRMFHFRKASWEVTLGNAGLDIAVILLLIVVFVNFRFPETVKYFVHIR
jgi:hypothetical protein